MVSKFVNSGNPYDDKGFGDRNWVEADDGINCGDRSILLSTGPFNIEVGESQEIVYAYIVDEGTDAFDSIRKLKEQVPLIQNLADNDFDFTKLAVKDSETIPDDFVLYQNYPNPFNPSTKIEYSLPSSSNVSISIHDISGKKVYSKVLGNQNEGLNSFEWNSTNYSGKKVPTGIYLVTVKAGTLQQTIKMLLIE